MFFEMRFDLGTLDSGERSLPFGLLVTYLYAFYDSIKIDMSLQFDFLPISVRKSDKEQSC